MLNRTFPRSSIASRRKLGLWPLVLTIFFCVSGGPYGLEPIVQSGRGMVLLLIVLVPLIWALPIALMSAELGSAIPEEGGYYEWVKRGIGPRAGFACAWLTYLYSCVDVAIYPVLFVKYLGALGFDGMLADPIANAAIRLAMIVPLTWINIRGATSAGNASMLFGLALLAPFVVMIAMVLVPSLQHASTIALPLTPTGVSPETAFTSGLFIILWNYLGWDSISTISREMENGARIFPKALMIGVPVVVLCYLLPVFAGLSVVPDITKWTEGSWPSIATAIGGRSLGTAIGIGGLLSAAGLFVAGLLAASRIPFVLAADGYMPAGFVQLHKKYGTPALAIIVSAAIYFVLSGFSFTELAVVDVLLYSAALLLEFLALVRLRKREPMMVRPFRIPGGYKSVIIISLLPALLIAVAAVQMLLHSWQETLALFAFAAITGAILVHMKNKRRIFEQKT